MKYKFLYILVSFLFHGILYGQENIGHFSNYSINSGLSQSTVLQIFQDRKGFLWMATTDGLNRFDGGKFTVFKNKYNNPNSLSDNWIVRILKEDSENNLWILTADRAINKYNPRTARYVRYLPSTSDSTGLQPFQIIFSTEEDTLKNIWISTNTGIFKFPHNSDKAVNFWKHNVKQTQDKVIDGPRIYKDQKGSIWFTSSIGLSKYDYPSDKLISYSKHPKKNNLPGIVFRMVEDKQNNLWAITEKGLGKYNATANNFKTVLLPKEFSFTSKVWVRNLLVDRKGQIWIGTTNGLLLFDPILESYKIFKSEKAVKGSISDNFVTRIFESANRNIWIGTQNGLNLYNAETSLFETYYQKPGTYPDNAISELVEVRGGEIWVIGSQPRNDGGHLSRVNTKTKYLETFLNDPVNPKSIPTSNVYAAFTDNSGNLWLGSFGSGAIKYTPRISNFIHFPNSNNEATTYSSIWGFCEDLSGNIWIASYEQGFSKYDSKKNTFSTYYPTVRDEYHNINYSVMSVCADKKGKIWVATMGAGLLCFDPATGKTKHFLDHQPKFTNNLIRVLTKNNAGELIIAHPNNGFEIFNTETNNLTKFENDPNDPNSLPSNNIWYVIQDKKGNYWISAEGVVSYYNTQNKTYTNYKCKSGNSIIADKALSMLESKNGDVWFGTAGGGLSKFSHKTGKFIHYTEDEGLANNLVYGLLEDEQGFLWLSTNNGMSKFDPQNGTFQNFSESAGLQSNEFNAGAFYKARNNKMYFGGINGFNVFDPSKIVRDTITPITVLTGFQIYNKTISVVPPNANYSETRLNEIIFDNNRFYLPENISYATHLILPPKVKVFTFEFAALLYNSPEKCTYRYKMEKFDDDWNYSGNRNFATYTNLPPGNYTFKIMAANADGIWRTQATELKITIVPPFWKTWWFITSLIIFVIVMVWLYVYVRLQHLHHSKILLEKTVSQRTKLIEEKSEELELRNSEILKQKEEIAFQAKQLKSELVHQNQTSELALLRSQVNPHFLFNTLNNIYSLVSQKSDDAAEAVMKLSETMRYMLYEANSDTVPLEKEINYLKSYIELQVLRLRNKECVDFSISGNMNGKLIAPMLLIPFVENAFKHGDKKSENPCIIINLALNGSHIIFTIENQFSKTNAKHKDQTGGIGLTNVRRRLELLHPYTHHLSISDTDGKFRVMLDLTLNDN